MPYSHENYLKYNGLEYNKKYRKEHPEKVRLWHKRTYERVKHTEEYKRKRRENVKNFYLRNYSPEYFWIRRYSYFEELQYYEDITKYDLYERIEKRGYVYGSKC